MNDDATESLLSAYAAGDRRAWEPLFDQLAPRLLGFFERCLHDRARAESHVQATFVQLHRARRTYRPGTPARLWVFSIAARVRVDDRSCLDRMDASGSNGAGRKSSPGEDERERLVRHAIDGLPNIERSILHLHRFEHMTFAAIAEVLGWSESAVRQRGLRAYHQLRERLWMLGDDGEGR